MTELSTLKMEAPLFRMEKAESGQVPKHPHNKMTLQTTSMATMSMACNMERWIISTTTTTTYIPPPC